MDRLRGYEMGAVDYVPVPVIPEVLRAKVKVFAELYRKTAQLEQLNAELEQRVAERTAELRGLDRPLHRKASSAAASRSPPATWAHGTGIASPATASGTTGQYRIFGVEPEAFRGDAGKRPRPDPSRRLGAICKPRSISCSERSPSLSRRIPRAAPEWRSPLVLRHRRADRRCKPATSCASAVSRSTSPIARRPKSARRCWRARSITAPRMRLALVQSIVRLTRAGTVAAYTAAVEGRIQALSRAHTVLAQSRWQGADLGGLVEEELAPFRTGDTSRISLQGPRVLLQPTPAQTLALALHELATNAAKYGALSRETGTVELAWEVDAGSTGRSPGARPVAPRPASPPRRASAHA